ncbi:hypothetical protein CWI42_012360 [Ordospora colligata]|uniref:Uncharacterized protein n=1 Tax=Ordospora colligata OC4 TaxID=1354746 RepID=A0A0B2UNP6_9MICR|nr:uncharacterized protein M896_012360 [Ordospora colligata OC4]KHN70580.1 hypothetical protein M896_012360 [Ordospora colligata OC4]TBU17330.1 hypothetical protein CWI41_012360 [Ordospora colligata]TBU17580.1 hypothetical protein CWI40_012360 [Ordospora colligata]TBU19760.1 hypothetical protein CWI42_012360 [Ordospora colligata]
MEPTDIYEFYTNKAIMHLKSTEIMHHASYICSINARTAVFDFCGKMPEFWKMFAAVEKEMFVVFDTSQSHEEIKQICNECEIVYILEDECMADKNVFFGSESVIFLLYNRFRFVCCV